MTFTVFVSIVLGVLMLVSGLPKFLRLPTVATQIRSYGVVPRPVLGIAAISLATVECGIGVTLLIPFLSRVAAVAAGALFMLFGVAVGINLAQGRRFDCGCGIGGQEMMIGPWLLCRNALLVGVAALVAIPPNISRTTSGQELLPAILGAILLVGMSQMVGPARAALSTLRATSPLVHANTSRPDGVNERQVG